MRLLEFVWCCGATGGEGFQKDSPDSVNGRRSEETRALVSPRALQTITMRRSTRRKRGRPSASSSSSATGEAEWKPTLCSISEDNVVVVVEEGTNRVVKRKGSGSSSGGNGGGSRDVACISSFNEDYRRSSHFTAIPTFSATPFMI